MAFTPPLEINPPYTTPPTWNRGKGNSSQTWEGDYRQRLLEAAIIYMWANPVPSGTLSGVAISGSTIGTTRITKRVVTVAQSATPTMNTDTMDVASITGLAQAITSMTTNLSGTPVDGDTLIVRITDNGTARAITWGAKFEPGAVNALPTTTTISTMMMVGFAWNIVTSAWRCVGIA
jgi:hypothetical protein